ncbi:MAG: LysM peptidoglycan-binding domain-containing protein [Chloroflexi bacterium]|nr:LysM peptidoglycan-binding domain-containing protein [Chloroflexota bacterium]
MHKLYRLLISVLLLALLVSCGAASSGKSGSAYTVRPGDTLSGIAAANGTTTAKLVALNKAQYPSLETDPSLIRVGWQLTLPGQGSTDTSPLANGNSPSGGSTPRTWAPPTAEEIRQVELEIIRLTNEARREHGLHELVEDPVLMDISRERAREIVSDYSHDGFPSAWERHGLGNDRWHGENIGGAPALTPDAGRSAVLVWMGSPGHRENILRPEFTRIGVGVYNPFGARWYGVQIFSS